MSSYSPPPLYEANSPPAKQYPSTHSMSSAFSASANPHEDWTKISDLAERRRIQNRIAQRNYRKKLKKRLEDLERRAGSSSASPEQQPAELVVPTDISSRRHRSSRAFDESSQRPKHHTQRHDLPDVNDAYAQQFLLPRDDGAMFSQQSTRQLSTSPPPFTYAMTNHGDTGYAYAQANGYCIPQSRQPIYGQFMQPGQQAFPMSCLSSVPIKSEHAGEDEMSPFSMSYASIANLDVTMASGFDISMAQSNHDVAPYTPSLLDPLDFAHPDSPPESLLCPRTPTLFPQIGSSYM